MGRAKHKGGGLGSNQFASKGKSKRSGSGSSYRTAEALDAAATATGAVTAASTFANADPTPVLRDRANAEPSAYAGLNDGSHWPKTFREAGASDERHEAAEGLLESLRSNMSEKEFAKFESQLGLRNLTDFGLEGLVHSITAAGGPSISPSKLKEGMEHPVFGKVTYVGLPKGQSSTVSVKFEGAQHGHSFNPLYSKVAINSE